MALRLDARSLIGLIDKVDVNGVAGQVAVKEVDGRSAFKRKIRFSCDGWDEPNEQTNVSGVAFTHGRSLHVGWRGSREP